MFQPRSLSKDYLMNASTNELLETLGFVKRSHSGLYTWLPLGLKTLDNIQSVVRRRLDVDAKAVELSLSSLSAKSSWESTGRWENSEMFKLRDGRKREYCLVPTCEETMTELVRDYVKSSKDLPFIVYQITRKFRDELRPRGGILRGREFLMKDAYSFARDADDALELFKVMDRVYNQIFKDLKLPYLSAYADSGVMGGKMSKEFHLKHNSGEDTVLTCERCNHNANIEVCDSFPIETKSYSGDVEVKYALDVDHSMLICFYYPKDRMLNSNLCLSALEGDLDISSLDTANEQVVNMFQKENEDPMFTRILRVMDCRLNSRSNFPDFPLTTYLKNNFGQINDVSLVSSQSGELCGKCRSGVLKSVKTIEIGHIFNLGTKYSEPLGLEYQDTSGSRNQVVMGSYGIGLSRLLGAIAEIGRDSEGLKWPSLIAPYGISVVVSPGIKSDDARLKNVETAVRQTEFGQRQGVLSCFHEKLGFGARIRLSHSIGVPMCVIVGSQSLAAGKVELELRKWDSEIAYPEALAGLECQVAERGAQVDRLVVGAADLGRVIKLISISICNGST